MGLNVKLFKEEKKNLRNIYKGLKKVKKIILNYYLNYLFFTNNFVFFMHAFNKDLSFLTKFSKSNSILIKKVSHNNLNNYFNSKFFVGSLSLIFMNNWVNFLNMFYILRFELEKYELFSFDFFLYIGNKFYTYNYINNLFKLFLKDKSNIKSLKVNNIYLELFKYSYLPLLKFILFCKNIHIVLYFNILKICQRYNS